MRTRRFLRSSYENQISRALLGTSARQTTARNNATYLRNSRPVGTPRPGEGSLASGFMPRPCGMTAVLSACRSSGARDCTNEKSPPKAHWIRAMCQDRRLAQRRRRVPCHAKWRESRAATAITGSGKFPFRFVAFAGRVAHPIAVGAAIGGRCRRIRRDIISLPTCCLAPGLSDHRRTTMTTGIGRRAFMGLLIGTAAAQPIPARAQQQGRRRTVGVLMGLANDAESQVRLKAFEQGLEREGWTLGQNLRIEYRFAAGYPERMRAFAKELVGLRPDVLVGHSTPVVTELARATRTVPIVFVVVADPVGSGFAASIPRPGGNVTGFTSLVGTIPGKMLTILKQIAPNLTRVALMLNPDASISAGSFYLGPVEAGAPSFSVEMIPAQVRVPADIEKRMKELAHEPNVGLIVSPDNFTTGHRHLIVSLAAQLRIPAVYPYRFFAQAGGLISYGVDVIDLFRRAPEYVSSIMRGASPEELQVQTPTRLELVINLTN